MAALCSLQPVASFGVVYDCCRTDASGAGRPSLAQGGASSFGSAGEGLAFTKVLLSRWGYTSSPPISRFPPNFVRQLSIKARRNCSNIGVAQVVAASATDVSASKALCKDVPENGLTAASNVAVAAAPADIRLIEPDTRGMSISKTGSGVIAVGSVISNSTLSVHGGASLGPQPVALVVRASVCPCVESPLSLLLSRSVMPFDS